MYASLRLVDDDGRMGQVILAHGLRHDGNGGRQAGFVLGRRGRHGAVHLAADALFEGEVEAVLIVGAFLDRAGGVLAHAAGNMGSMVLTFLGGTWVQQANMAAAVTAVARLTPIWWVIHAMSAVYAADGLTGELVGSVLAQSAIVALFAVAIAVAGTALARARARS